MEQDILDICQKLNKNPNDIIINSYKSKKKITYKELIEALLVSGSTTASAEYLKVTYRTITRATPKLGLPKLNGANSYKFQFLWLLGKKYCNKCLTVKLLSEFHSDKSSNTGLASDCKDCKSKRYSKWYYNNSEQHNLNTTFRQRSLDRQLTVEEVKLVFDRDNNKCQNCGLTNEEHLINFGQRLHLDHIIPISTQVLTTISNIQLLCRSCNSAKFNH